MKIAICDDEQICVDKIFELIMHFLKENNIQADVSCFTSGQEFLQSACEEYDLVFLDVNLDTMNGIDVARQFRQRNEAAVLVYASELLEYSPMGYEVNAFRYLLKCDLKKLFRACMLEVLQELSKRRITFPIKTDNGAYLVPIKEIVYVESQKRQVIFHIASNERNSYAYYDKLAVVKEKLEPLGFVRIQKSFLVNMEHIKYINTSHVILSDSTKLTISELIGKDVMRTYSLWKGRL